VSLQGRGANEQHPAGVYEKVAPGYRSERQRT